MYVKGLRYTFILTSCMLFLLFDTFYAHRTTFLFFIGIGSFFPLNGVGHNVRSFRDLHSRILLLSFCYFCFCSLNIALDSVARAMLSIFGGYRVYPERLEWREFALAFVFF